MFWRNGAKDRDHASLPVASSTQQTRRSGTIEDPVFLFWLAGRIVVGPALKMSACWCDRRELKPECTVRIGNRGLDHWGICRQGGRSCSSPGPPHPTSAAADAWLPTQMIGTVAAVPAWRPRGEHSLQFVSQITRTGNEKPVKVVDTRVYKRAYQCMSSIRGEGLTDDSQLSELEEADTRDVVNVPCHHHPTDDEDSQISNTVNGSKVDVRHPHSGNAAVMQTTTRTQPYQLRLWRVETKSVRTHPSLDALDAYGHPRS